MACFHVIVLYPVYIILLLTLLSLGMLTCSLY
nr:MAG TPA: conotoxin [Crassvirales sp.]